MSLENVRGRINAAQDFRRKARASLAAGATAESERQFLMALDALAVGRNLLATLDPPDKNDPTGDDRELAKIFADLWGIQGGVYRDMIRLNPKHSLDAIKAYDNGAEYERSFDLLSTYNSVNQIVLRILNEPRLLMDPSQPIPLTAGNPDEPVATFESRLRSAEKEVNRTLDERLDKAWAYADLLLLSALQPSSDFLRWRDALEQQILSDGDAYPLESLLLVVRDLCLHPSPVRSRLTELGEWLRTALPPHKRGVPLEG
jgi:hypothetical protein